MIPPELGPLDGYPTGPSELVILGPPGTGKSSAGLERFALPLLQELGPAGAGRLLMVSFTRAAARVLRQRLADALGGDPGDYRDCCRTIHSECWRLLRAVEGDAVQLLSHRHRRGPTEEDEEELPEVSLGTDDEDIEDAADQRRRAAVRLLDLSRQALRPEWEGLAWAYARLAPREFLLEELEADARAYQADKEARGVVDFTDVLTLALELDPPPRTLVLVDESQDLSELQWAIVDRWRAEAERFVALGDLDQAIHRWCGAAPERLRRLARSVEVRRLGRSHRVPAAPWRLAVPLIQLNRDRLEAPYTPAEREGVAREVTAPEAVERIRAAVEDEREVLVLARGRRVLQGWAHRLVESEIPFTNKRGPSPLRGETTLGVFKAVRALRAGLHLPLPDAQELLAALPAAACFPRRRKSEIRRQVGHWRHATVGAAELEAVGVRLGGLLGGSLREALGLALDPELAGYLVALLERWGPRLDRRLQLVSLVTTHGAKGDEAPLVVLDLEAPRAVVEAIASPAVEVDERQLLYVGVTRAREELLLVRHPRRDLGELLGLPSPASPRACAFARVCGAPHRADARLGETETDVIGVAS